MTKEVEKATLGGGCFWCVEAVFNALVGVEEVVSGYAGGHLPDPSYDQVCAGTTDHAEVVQITYDPDVITYEDLLYVFWRTHDPTTLNRQGADVGTQYRSIILCHDEEQRRVAERSREQTEASDLWPDPILTEIVPLEAFYPAEAYHQEYYERNRLQPYCRYVIDPKLAKFRKAFADRVRAD